MNRDTGGYGNAVVWYITVFLGLVLDWGLMKCQLGIEYVNGFGTTVKCIGDITIIMLPYWLLSPKLRWSALIPLWFASIWCVANLAYFRFWNDMIPTAAITMGGNIDRNLFVYGFALLRLSDLLFLIAPCLASLILIPLKPFLSPSFRTGMKAILVGLSILVGAAGQASYFKTSYSWRNAISKISIREGLYDQFLGGYTGQRQLYVNNGLLYYCGRYAIDAVGIFTSTVSLSDSQRNQIDSFLNYYSVNNDSVNTFSYRRNVGIDSLNVVFIIVESLNADMVSKRIGDKSVMPVLDSLSRKKGTVVFDNVVSQIKASSSSDGHLILLTGLLPPDKIAYSITFGSKNRFPSLADVLPDHNKYLLLADEGVCWNEGNTLRNFGLGEPLVIKDRPQFRIEELGRDGAMFRHAISLMDTIQKPFFMTLMTISMHIPFKEDAWKVPDWIMGAEGFSQMEKDYANVCNQTDRYIGEFLRKLPDNTIIFIASDHHQSIASDRNADKRAFFMAVNSGMTERISRTIGQVNLFPAVLDIMGRNTSYRGVAPSAFNTWVDGTLDSYGNVYGHPSEKTLDSLRNAYRISDLIIRSGYFGR